MWADTELPLRARRGYESARARRGAIHALLVAPVASLALVQCCNVFFTTLAIAALLLLVACFSWRGEDYARGSRVGLIAGLVPFFLPFIAALNGHVCMDSVCLYMPTACVLGGIGGGLTLFAFGFRPRTHSRAFALAALSVALTCGAVGCVFAGLAGLAGMARGLAAGSAPLLVAQRA
jgi:hypothetical protein